jgi:hypothetical protein
VRELLVCVTTTAAMPCLRLKVSAAAGGCPPRRRVEVADGLSASSSRGFITTPAPAPPALLAAAELARLVVEAVLQAHVRKSSARARHGLGVDQA